MVKKLIDYKFARPIFSSNWDNDVITSSRSSNWNNSGLNLNDNNGVRATTDTQGLNPMAESIGLTERLNTRQGLLLDSNYLVKFSRSIL